jgi:hypothetical protein
MLFVTNLLSLALSLGTFPFIKFSLFSMYYYLQCQSVPLVHCNWVPNHKGMVPTEVADGESRLQIWRVMANILNKQWPAADNCGPLEKGLGGERYEHLQQKPLQ